MCWLLLTPDSPYKSISVSGILGRGDQEHRQVFRSGVELELQLLAYTTAPATPDPSCVFNLHHSSQQCWILNPPIRARDRTNILMDTSLFVSAKPPWELPPGIFPHGEKEEVKFVSMNGNLGKISLKHAVWVFRGHNLKYFWPSRLRIQQGHCCGSSSVPDLGVSACCGLGKKKKKKKGFL